MTEENFWRRRVVTAGCWNWTGAKNGHGYGYVKRSGRKIPAPRVAWEFAHHTPPSPELFVCHTCDNPACINPDHLWLGTHQQNMDDRAAKGRTARAGIQGMRHGAAKLSTSDVRDILRLRSVGKSFGEIAKSFPVTRSQVSRICNGKNWKGHHEAQIQETHQEA